MSGQFLWAFPDWALHERVMSFSERRVSIFVRREWWVLMANVTVPQHAWGPDFLPFYVSSSFSYIIGNDLNGSNTFITTQCTILNPFLWPSLPLGGPKIQSKGYFWHVSILSPVEKSKQNQSKNVLSYEIMSVPRPLSIPQDTQKNLTHYANNELPKNGI